MSKTRISMRIGSDAIEIPDEFPDMRYFAGEFYERLETTGIELKEGIDELPTRERAMAMFLCG